jgi:ribonuclease-3
MAATSELAARLGHTFADPVLLTTALTHPSYVAEHPESPEDYQRLEFLGDAIIQLAVTQEIFTRFPDLQEGRLTKIRAALTRAATLARFARLLEIGPHIRLGYGEEMSGGADRSSTLCDVFEAVVGAVYLDAGSDMAPIQALLGRLVADSFSDLELLSDSDNPKGVLQEWTQKHLRKNPEYTVINATGPDHRKSYRVQVSLGGVCRGEGEAGKRQTAEVRAAAEALAWIREHHGE